MKIIPMFFLRYFAFSNIFLFIYDMSFSQQTDTASDRKGFSVGLNPTQFLMGEVRLLGEKYFNKHHSIELIASYLPNYHSYESLMQSPYGFTSRNGFKAGIGYRYYWNSKWYINPLFFYKYIIYDDAEGPKGFFKNNANIPGFSESGQDETYDYFIKIYALQFQMGYKIVSKHIVADFYWGAGLRYKKKDGVLVKYWMYDKIYDTNQPVNFVNIVPSLHLGFNAGYKK